MLKNMVGGIRETINMTITITMETMDGMGGLWERHIGHGNHGSHPMIGTDGGTLGDHHHHGMTRGTHGM